MTKIAPSLLAADFRCLQDEIRKVEEGGADMLHVDIMDGHFVPNLTMGPFIVEAIRGATGLFLDVHLMIEHPDQFIELFTSAGADNITIHLEACEDRTLDMISLIDESGVRKGVSIKPATPVSEAGFLKGKIDLFLIMSVEPGFGGQTFIEDSLEKISQAKALFGESVEIEVDGGITIENASRIIKAGADILVAGTAVFRADDPAEVIDVLTGVV